MKLPTTWTTRDGTVLQIRDMTDQHVINTIRFLRRRGFWTEDEVAAAFSFASNHSGSYGADAAIDEACAAGMSVHLEALMAEADRRGLDYRTLVKEDWYESEQQDEDDLLYEEPDV